MVYILYLRVVRMMMTKKSTLKFVCLAYAVLNTMFASYDMSFLRCIILRAIYCILTHLRGRYVVDKLTFKTVFKRSSFQSLQYSQ